MKPASSWSQVSRALVALVALGGCGGGGGGKRSPEEVIVAFVAAGKARDAAKVEALFPTRAQLEAAWTCDPGQDLYEEVTQKAKKWVGALGEFAADVDSFVRVEPRDARVIKSGETSNGCKANTDVTTQKVRVILKTTKGDEDGEGMDLIKLGDAGWFLFD